MAYVGWKNTNVNFTVHKVEQLNFKERGDAGVGKILKRSWCAFEFSPATWARSTFYILVAWFGLLLTFFSDGAMMILATNLRTPKRVLCRQTLFPKQCGHCTVYRELTRCPWSWPGWLEQVLLWGIPIPHSSLQNPQLSEGRGCFLPTPALISPLHSLRLSVPWLARVQGPLWTRSVQERQLHLSLASEMLEKFITI